MPIQITDGTTTLTFVTLSGAPSPSGPMVEPITRPGVDGVAARKVGSRGDSFTMTSLVDVANAAAVKTTEDSYRAMRGAVVSVTDTFDNTRANVLVEDVSITERHAVAVGVGGINASPAAIIRAVWTLRILQ